MSPASTGVTVEMVARAVDYGLHVTSVGPLQWTAAGPSAALAAWFHGDAPSSVPEDGGITVSANVGAIRPTPAALADLP